MKLVKCFFLLFGTALLSCSAQDEKINGVSFVAAKDAIDESHVTPVINVNANYAAIMPFAFIRNLNHPEVRYNSDRQWFGETEDGVRQYIAQLQKKRIKIMLKPQIWVWRGEFTGFIVMKSEDNWQTLENTYSDFILNFAKIAEETKADIFCIGTELELFVKYRPDYWTKLIKQIRQVYSGKLTYAANWDEYRRTSFWDNLDFIGVDAYFPVSESKTPTVEECINGWQKYKETLRQFSDIYKKRVLFTEFGYRSTDFTGRKPWDVDYSQKTVNLHAQTNATEALFETFWNEDWFAGGFIWKWFHNHPEVGGVNNSRFTPQNKPVEAIIKNYYSKE